MARVGDVVRSGDPQRPALFALGTPAATYSELSRLVAHLAAQLDAAGLRGRRIALLLPNGPEIVAAFIATTEVGSAAPLNPKLLPAEVATAIDQVGAAALITLPGVNASATSAPVFDLAGSWPDLRLAARDARPAHAVSPAQAGEALVLQTSGTTGRPKTVPLGHDQLLRSALQIGETLALSPGDRSLALMPLFHIHGIVASLLAALATGGSVACPPPFDPFQFRAWMAAFEPTWYSAVPTVHQAILQRRALEGVPHRLRFVRSSSAAMPATVREGTEALLGVPLLEAYGMTEAAHQIASNPLPPGIRKPGSVGRPMGVRARIVGEAGDVEPGVRGEVWLQGPTIIPRYEASDEVNCASFVDGWFRTGDQGYLDADGYLFLTGRLKELINRGGEKIAPGEIEEALARCPGVAQVIAFAVPHAGLGEEVGVAVVGDGTVAVDSETVRAFARGVLASFKVPRRVAVVDAIPLGPTGKIQRAGLAAALGLNGDSHG